MEEALQRNAQLRGIAILVIWLISAALVLCALGLVLASPLALGFAKLIGTVGGILAAAGLLIVLYPDLL